MTAHLARIEAALVRIEYARDAEHALDEAHAMAAEVRALLVLLADTTHTEPDPYEVAERMALDAAAQGDADRREALVREARALMGAA